MWDYADNPYLTALVIFYIACVMWFLRAMENAETISDTRYTSEVAHSCVR